MKRLNGAAVIALRGLVKGLIALAGTVGGFFLGAYIAMAMFPEVQLFMSLVVVVLGGVPGALLGGFSAAWIASFIGKNSKPPL
jgi:hypothetical protein